MSDPIRIGSRGSALALVQANWVADRLRESGVATDVLIIRTAGDDHAPDTAWGEGAFVTAIETALVGGRVDLAVHSAKDVPTEEDGQLTIAAWTKREDPRDALVCRERGATLATLPYGARVGTDSPRRTAFLRSVRPDLDLHPLSGNVDTRLRKLDAGESDALVLAVAGLTRLGRADRIDQILPIEVAVPAPGQGALALQVRARDEQTRRSVAVLDDPATRLAVQAERAFLAATGGGCRSPIGALGEVAAGTLTLHVAAERDVVDGVLRIASSAPSDEWRALAETLAARVVRLRNRARVLVTRPGDGASNVIDALAAEGFEAVNVPTIEVRPEQSDALDVALASAAVHGDWIVATSPNGVRASLAGLDRARVSAAGARWAVVGRASAAALKERGVTPFVPSRALGAALAAEVPVVEGERVVVVHGDLAEPTLRDALRARGALVQDEIGYRTIEAPESSRKPLTEALAEPVDAIVLASGSAARGLLALAAEDAREALRSTPAVCIGPSTAMVGRQLGFTRITESHDPGTRALVAAVTRSLHSSAPIPVAAGGRP